MDGDLNGEIGQPLIRRVSRSKRMQRRVKSLCGEVERLRDENDALRSLLNVAIDLTLKATANPLERNRNSFRELAEKLQQQLDDESEYGEEKAAA